MTDLPSGIDFNTMLWAIAWKIVEASVSNKTMSSEEKIKYMMEKTKEVRDYFVSGKKSE